MKKLLLSFLLLLLFNGCSKKPYKYPNYDVIKPSATLEPKRVNIRKQLDKHYGKPYVWAEEGPDAFDCSGLTYNIFNTMDVDIPRVAREQAKVGKTVAYDELVYGDLIFFTPEKRPWRAINHVGIYLGDGNFAHASSDKRAVVIGNFEKEPVYKKRIKVCKRYMSRCESDLYLSKEVALAPYNVTRWTSPWQKGMRLPRKAVP